MTRNAKIHRVVRINHKIGIVVYPNDVMNMPSRLRASLATIHCTNANFAQEDLIRASFVKFLSELCPLAIEVFVIAVLQTLEAPNDLADFTFWIDRQGSAQRMKEVRPRPAIHRSW